ITSGEYSPDEMPRLIEVEDSPEVMALPTPCEPMVIGTPWKVWARYATVGILLIALTVVLVKALAASAYGLAIGTVCLVAVFVPTLSDARATIRAGLAVLTTAAMAYIASASTLPYV